MSRIFLTGIGACVLAVILWILVFQAEPQQPATTADDGVEAQSEERSQVDASGVATARDAASEAPQREETTGVPGNEADAEETAGLWTVRVLSPDGTPAAGATVTLFAQTGAEAERMHDAWLDHVRTREGGVYTFYRSHGTPYRTDAQGVAHVPPPTVLPYLQADHGLATGLLPVHDPEGTEFTIQMHERVVFEVQVVDTSGSPVPGAPVAIVESRPGNGPRDRSFRFADAQGRAQFDDAVRTFHDQPGEARPAVTVGILVSPDLAVNGQSVTLTDDVLAAGSCTLTAPPHGAVAVRVVHADGRPVTRSGAVSVSLDGSARRAPGPGLRSRMNWLDGGRTVIPGVGLNQELRVTYSNSSTGTSDTMLFAGPTRPGELLEVVLECAARTMLTGRVLMPDGQPPQGGHFESQVAYETAARKGASGITLGIDEEGRFAFAVAEDTMKVPASRLDLTISWFDDAREQWQARTALPVPLPEAGLDVGELVLRPRPVLLAGTVLDADGEAVQGAELRIEAKQAEMESVLGNWSFQGFARSAADGSFRVYGSGKDGMEYRVDARHAVAGKLFHTFLPGQDAVVLRLTRQAMLSGRILVDPDIDLDALQVVVEPEEGSRSGHLVLGNRTENRGATLEASAENGVAELRAGLAPGEAHRLRITTAMRQTVFALDGLVAAEGEELAPAALQPLDLRGRLRPVVVTVRAADGSVPAHAGMSVPRADGVGADTIRAQDGTLETLILDALHDVQVFGSGSRVVHLPVLDGNREVTLEAGVPCTVTLPAHLVDRDDVIVHASLGAHDPKLRAACHHAARFDRQGRAELALPEAPGSYYVRISVEPIRSTNRRRATYPGGALPVEATAAGQTIALGIDEALFVRMLEVATE